MTATLTYTGNRTLPQRERSVGVLPVGFASGG
jgi:hypothetical protein